MRVGVGFEHGGGSDLLLGVLDVVGHEDVVKDGAWLGVGLRLGLAVGIGVGVRVGLGAGLSRGKGRGRVKG